MNRLKQILFAGTLVPAIVLTPLSGAFAQATDQERSAPGGAMRGPQGQGGAGGMRGPQGGAGGMTHGGEMQRGGGVAVERQRADAPSKTLTGQTQRGLSERLRERQQQIRDAQQSGAVPGRTRTADPAATPGRTPRAADAQRAAPNAAGAERTRREAADPNPASSRAGSAGQAAGTPPATRERNAATPQTAPSRAGNAAQDERRSAPNTAAQTERQGAAPAGTAQNQRRGAPGTDSAQGDRRGTPNNTAGSNNDRTPGNDRMQGNNNRMPGANDRMQGNNDRDAPRTPNDRRDNADRGGNRDRRDADRGERGISPGGAAAIGAAAGFAGGFLAATGAQRLDDVRRDRREVVEDGRTYIREPGRTIVEDGDRSYIVHDENDRFRELGYDVRRERRGRDYIDTVDRPGGVQIITYTDDSGRMLRRVRRDRSGHEFVLIDNSYDGGVRNYRDDVVELPPPPMRIARDRYAVDYRDADEGLIYDTLIAPPLAAPPRRYTLDQIRYSPDVRSYVRSVDINTINFDSGSWIVPASATGKLEALASAIKRATERNPNSVFLVEGFTDLTGNPTDNLSLSDRRAQSVAAILTKSFNVPPENLTTQGYGQQNPKVNTQGPSVENRRVVVQNITQLLASNDQAPPNQ